MVSVDAEDDRLFLAQLVAAQHLPEILGDPPGLVGEPEVALEAPGGIASAIGSREARVVEVVDPFLQQIGDGIPVLDRLLQGIEIGGQPVLAAGEVDEGVTAELLRGEPATPPVELRRRGRQAQLEGVAEVLEDAEPVAEPRAVALVDDDEVEVSGGRRA